MSPTVLSIDGFAVRIYLPPREHGPAHLHVVKNDGEVVIVIGNRPTEIEIREVYGMREADIRRAIQIVSNHHADLLYAWGQYHG
jgi:hypothetical protein